MNLIINAKIANPPTQDLALRFITLSAKGNLQLSVLFESFREERDTYLKFLRGKGLMDFAEDLIFFEDKEEGIRIDTSYNYPFTIKVNVIDFASVPNLLGQISFLKKINSRQ